MAPKPIAESSQPVFPKVLFCIPFSIVEQNVVLSQHGAEKVNPETLSQCFYTYYHASSFHSNVLESEGKSKNPNGKCGRLRLRLRLRRKSRLEV